MNGAGGERSRGKKDGRRRWGGEYLARGEGEPRRGEARVPGRAVVGHRSTWHLARRDFLAFSARLFGPAAVWGSHCVGSLRVDPVLGSVGQDIAAHLESISQGARAV